MGWFSALFGKRPLSPPLPPPSAIPAPAVVEDQFFSLEKPQWFGPFSRSPNGRWLISWRDSDPSGSTGGARTRGKGAYLLYDVAGKRVVLQGRLERPNTGHVADNGTFVLEDWHFANELAGTLYAFDAQGHKLLARRLSANLLDNAVSANGRYAACQTASSSTDDSVRLFLFDLASGQQMFAVRPSAGAWTTDLAIDASRVEVVAHIKGLGAFRYDAHGTFLDQADLEHASLTRGDYSTVIRMGETLVQREGVSPAQLREVLTAVQRARREGADDDRGWAAAALKVQGLTYEALGDAANAMAMYEQALSINPKVGLKRKLAALQKRHK
jgi:tetratricopeptide (TPR) repeat protein